MSHPVIRADGVSKFYRLGLIGGHTLRTDVNRWWARLRGRADPEARLDARQDGGDTLWALQDVSFDVAQGEVLGVIGRNGAGKSTLLKILSRVTAPTAGEIRLRGRLASLLEVGTGFHPELTGRENIFLNGAILGMTRREVRAKFDEIVEFSEIGPFIDTPVKRYSSGMYVRLAFAVAAHLEPEILIVDEVLAVGDASFQRKCIGKMGTVAGQGRTVLFVSHNMTAVAALCTKVLYLKQGRLAALGPVPEILQRYHAETRHSAEAVVTFESNASGAPAIARACVLDAAGHPTNQVPMGQPFAIQVEFNAGAPVRNPILGIRINTPMGVTVLGIASQMSDDRPVFERESGGVFQARFPAPCLNQGAYSLTLTLSSDQTVLDRKPDVLGFDVLPADVFGTGRIPSASQSLVFSPTEWRGLPADDRLWL